MRLRTLKSPVYKIGVVLLFLLSPLLAFADDLYEPNNSTSQAYDVSGLGSNLDGIMAQSDYYDYYKLTVPANVASLDISLNFTSQNLDLRLRDSTGTQLVLANDTTGTSELITYANPSAGIYYMQVLTSGVSYDVPYTLSWTQFPPTVSSPDPADGAEVEQGRSGQLLRVTTSQADSCMIYYGIGNSTFASVAGTMNGEFCETTVPYGAGMLKDGVNYWYVEATNSAGTTRFPDGTSTLSFTVTPRPTSLSGMMLLLLKGTTP